MAEEVHRLPIPSYEGVYEITRDGRVFSLSRQVTGMRNGSALTTTVPARELRTQTDRYGYRVVSLSACGVTKAFGVHRLVCRTFHGEPPARGMHAAHIDGDKVNNIVENLRWATPAENNEDRRVHGVHPMGERLPHTKLTAQKVREIVTRSAAGEHYQALASEYGVTGTAIRKIRSGRSWRHVTGFAPHPDILAEIDRLNANQEQAA